MLRDVGNNSRNSTLLIPHTPGAVGDLGAQIRHAFMEGNAAGDMLARGHQ